MSLIDSNSITRTPPIMIKEDKAKSIVHTDSETGPVKLGDKTDYQHSTLRLLYGHINPWQTRLLRLNPGHGDQPLQADLVVVDLVHLSGAVLHDKQELVEYDVISYSWGAPTFNSRIILNGHTALITPTLYGALRRFRLKDQARLIWADAPCINQHDTKEKSMQVRNMYTIFRKADKVLVWLGDAGEFTPRAIACLNQSKPSSQVTEYTKELRDGLFDLCTRPWSRRAWIQQEVFAAKDLTVYCGADKMSLDTYRSAVHLFAKVKNTDGLDFKLTEDQVLTCRSLENLKPAKPKHLAELEAQRDIGQNGVCARQQGFTYTDMYDFEANQGNMCTRPECVMAEYRNILASNQRDRIYALLPMTSCRVSRGISSEPKERGHEMLNINYSYTPSQVFQSLTKYIMNQYGSLDILFRHKLSSDNELKLPTWTPDWRQWRWHLPDTQSTNEPPGIYSGHFQRKELTRLDWQDDNHDGTLRFHSVAMGCISKVEMDSIIFQSYWGLDENLRDGFHPLRSLKNQKQAEYTTLQRKNPPHKFFGIEPGDHNDDFWAGDVMVMAPNTSFSVFLRPREPEGFLYVGVCPLYWDHEIAKFIYLTTAEALSDGQVDRDDVLDRLEEFVVY